MNIAKQMKVLKLIITTKKQTKNKIRWGQNNKQNKGGIHEILENVIKLHLNMQHK